VFYLHNFPSPPTGDTASQADLPCDQTVPIASTLFNYDADRDAGPGRGIARGGSGPGEVDPAKHQQWLTPGATVAVTINGTVRVDLWTAAKDFSTAVTIQSSVYLSDVQGGSRTVIAQAGFTFQGTASWSQTTVFMGVSGFTLAPGHSLELTVIAQGTSADDLWLAYDTTAYKSRIVLP
jgi:hypothetical protein